MSDGFQLIDLVSQAGAVRKLLDGKTDSEKLAWLSEHGHVGILPSEYPEQKQSYRFTSTLGREAIFFFEAGGFVFVGDHTRTQSERAARRRSCEPPGADGSMRFWRMHQLWELAEGQPSKKVRLSELNGFDDVCWFGGPMNLRPTCRAIAEHARDIYASDLSYPIILSPKGEVLDGWHRVCKAFVMGIEELDAVQLPTLPLYRWRVLVTGEEVEILDEAGQKPREI